MFLTKLINKIDEDNINLKSTNKSFQDKKIEYKLIKKLSFFNKYIIRKFFYLFIKLSLIKISWNVHFSKIKNFDISKVSKLKTIKIINPKNSYLADPFIINIREKNLLFAEEFNFKTNKGNICLYEIKKNSFKRIGIIINENFHLSYPFVFKIKNRLFLIPESCESNNIRLYECIKFPNKWKLKKILIKGVKAIDPILVKKNKIWWLIFNSFDNNFKKLNIYYNKKNLFSDNWIKTSNNRNFLGRNGGSLKIKNKIYRVSQFPSYFVYGKKIVINLIKKINKKSYIEKKIQTISPKNFDNKILGIHHMNNNKNYICFDTLEIL